MELSGIGEWRTWGRGSKGRPCDRWNGKELVRLQVWRGTDGGVTEVGLGSESPVGTGPWRVHLGHARMRGRQGEGVDVSHPCGNVQVVLCAGSYAGRRDEYYVKLW